MYSRCFIPILIILVNLTLCASANASTPLEKAMKQMSNAYKALSFDLQQPSEANKSNYLTLAGILKTQAQTSRELVPKKAATLPADQQAAMVTAYQKSMDDLMQSIDSLTQDIQNSHWDDARKAMAGLKQQMTDGHKAFRVRE